MSPCLSKYPFSNKFNIPPPTAPLSPPGLESPWSCDKPILLPRYHITYPPQLISSYEQTTSIVPVKGWAKIPREVFSSRYIDLSLLITTNDEHNGTDTVIAIETVLTADA